MSWTRSAVPSLDGRVVVVTGANSGLGYEATKTFARRGATVIMACRSTDRGDDAAAEIRQEANTGVSLDVRACDLADLDSVRSFAAGVHDAYEHVDILCNNAGVMAVPRRETADGFELQFGVNHLGHFALTGRLFDLLVAGEGESRVVTQSSGAHEQAEMAFEDLNGEQSYSKWDAYGQSKLANVLFAYELQRRVERAGLAGVTSLACHPGYAATNLQHRMAEESATPLVGPITRVANAVFAQSAEQGALPMLYAATADVTGGTYVGPDGLLSARGHPEPQRSSDASYSEGDARRLWEISRDMTGVTYPFDGGAAP